MSSIHYKFKSTLQYKTLQFEGLHISVDELKKIICEKENIKNESFDLIFTNAHTKRQYGTDDYVPRNCSVIVQRMPRENAAKLPKVQDTSTSGVVSHGAANQDKSVGFMTTSEFEKLTEEQRLAHVKEVSYQKYQPSNYNRKGGAIMSGPPPPTYTCNRCYQHGHWLKNCPLQATKRTTGIPMEELMETTKDDPRALLHPSGKFVVPIMHYQARQQRKQEHLPAVDESLLQAAKEIPPELACPLCNNLLREAVLATCCGDSFCAECIQQRVLEEQDQCLCPNPECHQRITADSLVPNNKMRQATQKFLSTSSSSPATSSVTGANKPCVTNADSLLHKLLPDLSETDGKVPQNASSSPSVHANQLPSTAAAVPAQIVSVGHNSNSAPIVSMPYPSSFNIPPPNYSVPPPIFLPVNASAAPGQLNLPMTMPDIIPATSSVASNPTASLSSAVKPRSAAVNGFNTNEENLAPGEIPSSNNRSDGNTSTSTLDDSSALSLAWESLLKRDEKKSINLFDRDGPSDRSDSRAKRSADRDRDSKRDLDRDRHNFSRRHEGSNARKRSSTTLEPDRSDKTKKSKSGDSHWSHHGSILRSRDRNGRSHDTSSSSTRSYRDRSRDVVTKSRDYSDRPRKSGISTKPTNDSFNEAEQNYTKTDDAETEQNNFVGSQDIEVKQADNTVDDDEDEIERIILETQQIKQNARVLGDAPIEEESYVDTTAKSEVSVRVAKSPTVDKEPSPMPVKEPSPAVSEEPSLAVSEEPSSVKSRSPSVIKEKANSVTDTTIAQDSYLFVEESSGNTEESVSTPDPPDALSSQKAKESKTEEHRHRHHHRHHSKKDKKKRKKRDTNEKDDDAHLSSNKEKRSKKKKKHSNDEVSHSKKDLRRESPDKKHKKDKEKSEKKAKREKDKSSRKEKHDDERRSRKQKHKKDHTHDKTRRHKTAKTTDDHMRK